MVQQEGNDRRVLNHVRSHLVDLVAIELPVGSVSERTSCPDGQFWLPIRGEQLISGASGRRRQKVLDLAYYAPKEHALRKTELQTVTYGVQIRLSKLQSHEHDAQWLTGRPADPQRQWATQKNVLRLLSEGFARNTDPHRLDEIVAQWVAAETQFRPESPRAPWMGQVIELLRLDPTMNLLALSRTVGIVPAYISSEFSRTQGVTLSRFRRQVMLQRAFVLADDSNLNEAAIEAGFYDASHFHRTCFSELSIKPAQLRQILNANYNPYNLPKVDRW